MSFDLNQRLTPRVLRHFANYLLDLQSGIDFKISSRGWCYQLEVEHVIDKSQFDKVEDAINRCRKRGLIPADFVAEEAARDFSGVEIPSYREGKTIHSIMRWMLRDVLDGGKYFVPDWWEDEKYYIQVVVEKIDLKTLFEPVCKEFHIPIATSKGWSSILQRATYARRFAEAQDQGLQCVLLYCGDHDPDGLRISQFMEKNLFDIRNVVWADGTRGYDPQDLIIQRFGLNQDFIEDLGLTWIDNLITGGKKNLASPSHPNFRMDYVQKYLAEIGERKCEANAIIPYVSEARGLMRAAIHNYLGTKATERFEEKRERADDMYEDLLEHHGLRPVIESALEKI